MSVLDWIKTIVQAIGVALGVVEEVKKEATEAHPKLMPAPPPGDKTGLVRDLNEARDKKFGKQ